MKTVKIILVLTALFAFPFSNVSAKGGKEKVVIQTSAICESCQHRIEKALNNVDGVKSASLDLKNKKVTVVYDPAKTSADQLKQTISNTGYDADDLKANPQALNNLPSCCQPTAAGKGCAPGSKGCNHK